MKEKLKQLQKTLRNEDTSQFENLQSNNVLLKASHVMEQLFMS